MEKNYNLCQAFDTPACESKFCYMPTGSASGLGFCCCHCQNMGKCFNQNVQDLCQRLKLFLYKRDQLEKMVFFSGQVETRRRL